MDTYQTVKSSKMKMMKATMSVKKSFIEGVLRSIKSLLQSQKELCGVSAEECLRPEEHANMIEVTFLGFNEETDAGHMQDLPTLSLELPDLLNSIHFCNLSENEIIFLKDVNKSSETNAEPQKQNHFSSVLCVMRVSPATFPRLRNDFIFNLLSKYATGIRYTLETYLRQKRHLEKSHGDDDDTNQSVSSIEDDFVTAFEQLDEEEPSKMHSDGMSFATLRSQCDAASQTIPAHCLEASDSEVLVSSVQQKSVAKSSPSLINVLGFKERPSNGKNSVTTSISEPWTQRSFYKSCHPSDTSVTLPKTLFSASPADSSESECSSPSPVIFLDEEGYQKSLKAKLELPKIPVGKDGIEDSDSEIGEFFDSFDQFDELEQASDASCQLKWEPVIGNPSKKRVHKHGKSCSITTTMNPQKFKFDRPTLPANVRKPTPRKPESPYSNLYDVPDSPRPVKTSGEDSGLFSPIRSSAFSPLGSCTTTECYCHIDDSGERFNENHDNMYHAYSDYANSISCEILGSVFHSQLVPKCTENISFIDSVVSTEGKSLTIDLKHRDLDWKVRSKHKSLMIKENIQKYAADLVEKSFGHAFKDLQKGVSSCTSAFCSLAMKLTSSVFDMAFNEIGRRRAFLLKERAISGLANFLVGDALTTALRDLHYVKKQIFTNTAARFAADLAEELIFEGLMEVCQFSHPPTPTGSHNSPFDFEDKVVRSYAKDLSESVIQEAFIELSQVDVTFTTKAAISVSMDNIKYVSTESVLQSTQTSTSFPACHDQVLTALNPVQDYRKDYTVQQALFCTSGIVTSIPVPLAGSALGRYHTSSNKCQESSHLLSDNSHKMHSDSTQTFFMTKNKEEEAACLKNICLPSNHSLSNEKNYEFSDNQNDLKLPNSIGINSCSELACGLSAINNFSGTMVDMIVAETYEAIASSKVAKVVGESSDYLLKDKAEEKNPLPHGGASLQYGESSSKNNFADQLSKYIIKHSINESKFVAANNKNVAHSAGMPSCAGSIRKDVPSLIKKYESTEKQQFLPALKEEPQLTPNKPVNFPDGLDQSTQDMSSLVKDFIPEYKGSMAPKFASDTLPPCPDVTSQGQNTEELTEAMDSSIKPFDRSLKKHDLNKTLLGPLPFGQEIWFSSAHTFSPTVLSGEDISQVEDKQKIRDGNIIPDTPPPTPLVPPQTSSEQNLRKLTKKLKGELAKEFAPATPPSTPRNPSLGLSESEQNTIEKEEFMLKLMRSLSEEVESSEDEEYPEMHVKSECSEKTAQYANNLATHILSLATDMAASYLYDKTFQGPTTKSHLNVQHQPSGYTTLVNKDETLQCLQDYAGDVAGEVIREAKKMVKSRHCKLLRLRKNSICLKRDERDCCSKEKWNIQSEQWPREVDPLSHSLCQNSFMSGLTSKYPSCESVTDEYAGHIIQVLKREGANSELIMDQYASRLAYRSVKSGLQQAARKLQLKYNRKIFPVRSSQMNSKNELLKFLNKDKYQIDKKGQGERNIGHLCESQVDKRAKFTQRIECPELLRFSDSLAYSITQDVTRKLKLSTVGLPKSLTDSCLYKKSTCDEDMEAYIESAFSKSLQLSSPKQKLYHSTSSLNECGYGDSIIQAIEQYAKKIVDDTLEISLESAVLQASKNRKSADKFTYAEKLSTFSGTACRYCNLKEHQDCTGKASQYFFGQESSAGNKPVSHSKLVTGCQKSRLFHFDVPRIHIDLEQKVVLAEKIVAAAIEKAERELSNISVAADSGIGKDGVSFADSLTAEIMTSALTNIGHNVNISSIGKEGFQSVESVGSQQMSLSIGDDSSWSNLSFEDDHHDESSSFLHLSDSNGNSSSWSSLGLEGDMYEENLSFPTSDSDGTDNKDEEHKHAIEGLEKVGKKLLIVNIDMASCVVDSQLRLALQWLAASEAEVEQLYFHGSAKKEFMLLSKRVREKEWKVRDLLQAVLKYYEMMEKASDEERRKPLFCWILENV